MSEVTYISEELVMEGNLDSAGSSVVVAGRFKGELVNEGQVIGKMGRTGKVKGAHLHYEISVNGKSQNPATYIKIGRSLLSRTSLKSYVINN